MIDHYFYPVANGPILDAAEPIPQCNGTMPGCAICAAWKSRLRPVLPPDLFPEVWVISAVRRELEEIGYVDTVTPARVAPTADSANSLLTMLNRLADIYVAMRDLHRKQPNGLQLIKTLIERTLQAYRDLGFEVSDPETRWRVDKVPTSQYGLSHQDTESAP